MADNSTLLIPPRDYSDICKLQEPGALEQFFDEPLPFIVETVTGALADGLKGWPLVAGRIVQGLLKGSLFQQTAWELKRLREAGRIPADFADKPNGFATWVELMRIIDEESPDAVRLEALKAMFFAFNKVDADDGQRIAAYQLWHIAKALTSGELLLLKTAYDLSNRVLMNNSGGVGLYADWAGAMAKAIGHGLPGLIDLHERRLVEFGLLIPRVPGSEPARVSADQARLSHLGIRFCENIEKYQLEIEKLESAGGPKDE